MWKENKLEVIDAIQAMCRATSHLCNLVIEVGYRDWNGNFVPSNERLNWLCFHWQDQERKFGRYQSIEADSGFGIILDAMKVISKLG